MGNFYVNFTVKGSTQQEVAQALKGRSALVAPERGGCVVCVERKSDRQSEKIILEIGGELSQKLDRAVLAVMNHDDDVLVYHLFNAGKLIDSYNSCPDYFNETDDPSGPKGGNAEALCTAFASKDVKSVEAALRGNHVFAIEKHTALLEALGLPALAAGAGYQYWEAGEFPGDLDAAEILRVQ